MSECPCCGSVDAEALFAVCDVLVLKALEAMGKWIVRADRSRFKMMNGRPYYMAHTLWRAEESMVDKALRGAWDVVPAMMLITPDTARRVTATLDSYVRDLAITGTPHSMDDLHYRFDREFVELHHV